MRRMWFSEKSEICSSSPSTGPPFLIRMMTGRPVLKEKARCPKKPQRSPKEVILDTLKEQSSISIRELSVRCNMSVHTVQHHINKLKEVGVIQHVGPTKAGRWEVAEDHVDTFDDGAIRGGDE